jgi:uncharacterized protein YutE (UPF0331/DUF86 family)
MLIAYFLSALFIEADMTKNTYYFPHDYHARHDPKLSALIKKFGMEGYGVYWNLIEILHEQGGQLEKFPKLYEGLSHELNINEAELKQIISASINDFHLLKEDEKHIWSNRARNNIRELLVKRSQKVAAGRLGGIKSGEKRKKTKQCLNQTKQTKQSKVKESKVNKSKVYNIYKEHVYLTNEQYSGLIEKLGDGAVQSYIEKLNNYIGSKGKRYKSHYHTILVWADRDRGNLRSRPTQAQINSMASMVQLNERLKYEKSDI